jgi:Tfp pilus assembly protein PilN
MNAVNLIPLESRGAGSNGRAGVGAYAVLGGLAALVAASTLWTVTGKQISEREATLAQVTAQAQAAEASAGDATPFQQFSQIAQQRSETVKSLATTRFDWSHAMREISRVLPADVWMTTMTGSAGATDDAPTPASSAAPAPTFELVGCTRSQTQVANLMARLRAVDGVRKVSLRSSEKPEATATESECPASRASDPKFSMVISFKVPGGTEQPVDALGQVPEAAPAPAAGTAAAPAGATATAPADPTASAPTAVPAPTGATR